MVMITVTRKRTETVTIDVEFPLYFTYDVMPDRGSWVVHTRVEENGRKTQVRESCGGRNNISWEVEVDEVPLGADHGSETCTAEEFNSALARAKMFVAGL